MLLPDNIHPENTLFYNGALILRALDRLGEVSLIDLYFETHRDNDVTMSLFVLALDWLYLAECVAFNQEGRIVRCS